MDRLDEYANDRKQMFESLKAQAKLAYKHKELTESGLVILLNESFRLGRYVGHCQGEKHAEILENETYLWK